MQRHDGHSCAHHTVRWTCRRHFCCVTMNAYSRCVTAVVRSAWRDRASLICRSLLRPRLRCDADGLPEPIVPPQDFAAAFLRPQPEAANSGGHVSSGRVAGPPCETRLPAPGRSVSKRRHAAFGTDDAQQRSTSAAAPATTPPAARSVSHPASPPEQTATQTPTPRNKQRGPAAANVPVAGKRHVVTISPAASLGSPNDAALEQAIASIHAAGSAATPEASGHSAAKHEPAASAAAKQQRHPAGAAEPPAAAAMQLSSTEQQAAGDSLDSGQGARKHSDCAIAFIS